MCEYKKVNAIQLSLDEFQKLLDKATVNSASISIDKDRNEWCWDTKNKGLKESQIIILIEEYIDEKINDIVVEIDGFFDICKIVLILE